MNPKMKSAIEKITLNDATFSNEVIEPTYVNFFYGKNGAGKSTIARTFKANDERLQWQAGKASTDYDVLVYDTDFINANLRNYGNLAGVFTVNETNIAIQEQVDTLNAERKKMGEEYNGHKAAIDQKTADKNTALSTFQSDCWSKSAEARTLFDEAIKVYQRTCFEHKKTCFGATVGSELINCILIRLPSCIALKFKCKPLFRRTFTSRYRKNLSADEW